MRYPKKNIKIESGDKKLNGYWHLFTDKYSVNKRFYLIFSEHINQCN